MIHITRVEQEHQSGDHQAVSLNLLLHTRGDTPELSDLATAMRKAFRTTDLADASSTAAEALVKMLLPAVSPEGRQRLADEFLAKALL